MEKLSETPSLAEEQTQVGEVEIIPQLRKSFNFWSTLGLLFSVTATPLAIGTYLSFSLGVGGGPVFVYGYLLAVGMSFFICLSLAEISAVYPHVSGQIYWVAVTAPQQHARWLSYVCGWLTSAAWLVMSAGTYLFTSQLIWAVVLTCRPAFELHPWHVYIVYLVVTATSVFLNTSAFKAMPILVKGFAIFLNAGTIFIFVALLVRASPKQNAEYVFVDIVNATGWKSNGVVFCLGLLPGITAVGAWDSAAHIAEEMTKPSRQVPQVMLGSSILSAIAGFAMLMVYEFCTVNPENLLTPIGGQPIAQLLLDSLDSVPLAVIGEIIFVLALAGSGTLIFTTFSRVWWSFARQNGVPFSPFMATIDNRYHVPVNTILTCSLFLAGLGAIQLGSVTALNALVGSAIILINLSYLIPIICFAARGRDRLPRDRYFNLGRMGLPINVVAVLWIVFFAVWLCIPQFLPVTGPTMNYAAPVVAGLLLVAGANWFLYSRTRYTSPSDAGLE